VQIDYDQAATACFVSSQSDAGLPISASVVDTVAEQNLASLRFNPRRVSVLEDMSGTTIPGILAMRAGSIAQSAFQTKIDLQIKTFLNLGVARRDRVLMLDAGGHGIPDNTIFWVRTQDIDVNFDRERGEWNAEQRLGLRVL